MAAGGLSVSAEGAEAFDKVAYALRTMGARDLSRELSRGLNEVTEPLKEDARERAREVLPRRGGLAERVANAKLTTRRRGGRNPGVRIAAKGMTQLEPMDRGWVRHPVFGTDAWVTQQITPGWFSDPMAAGKDDAARELMEVLNRVAIKLAARLEET